MRSQHIRAVRTTIVCLMIALGVPTAASTAGAQSEQIVQVLPRDAIPAIDSPTFEPTAKARL